MKVRVFLAGWLLFLASNFAVAETLYGTTAAGGPTSNLYILNPANGAVIASRPIGYAVTGLAVHPITGELYGSTSNNSGASPRSLIKISKVTGAGTVVGAYGQGSQTMADITFASDGTLYGWLEASTDSLFTINITTGAAILVGASGLSTYGSGLAANSSNVLYYAGSGADGPLRTIDRTTGLPTTVATLTGAPAPTDESISALAFNGAGVLYGVYMNTGPTPSISHLLTINTTTAAITDLGLTVPRLDGIVFDPANVAFVDTTIPTLSATALLLLAGLLAVAAFFARRRFR